MAPLICSPCRTDKNLGRAYNETMRLLPDDGWAIFKDIDTTFLTPETYGHICTYIEQNPEAGVLTCYTNRLSPLAKRQLLGGVVSEDTDVRHHIALARECERELYTTTAIIRDISGVLMAVSKKTWNRIPFPETGRALGVDNTFGRLIRGHGEQVLRMNGIYIFHLYRLEKGIGDKTHLKP